MSAATSHQSVKKIYQSVIDDVVLNIRDVFIDDGIDEQILQELRMIWESKLAVQKAVEHAPTTSGDSTASAKNSSEAPSDNQSTSSGKNNSSRQSAHSNNTSSNQTAPPAPPQGAQQILPGNLIPIQITVPRLPTDPPNTQRTMSIQVPASCIQSNKLQEILSLPEVQSILTLPLPKAAEELQSYVNQILSVGSNITPPFEVGGGANNRGIGGTNNILQSDGGVDDSSDEDEEEEDDEEDLDDDLDFEKDDEKDEEDDVGQDEEPLNSGDDVSDAEDSNDKLYEVDNVVVCQYDKITRTRNKWKFHLKDGIMNLNGKDYVFQKANGDAEW